MAPIGLSPLTSPASDPSPLRESSPEVDAVTALFERVALACPPRPIRHHQKKIEEYKTQIFLALQTPMENPGNPLHLRRFYYVLKEASPVEIKEWTRKVIHERDLPEDLTDFFISITEEGLHMYRTCEERTRILNGRGDIWCTNKHQWKPIEAYGAAAFERLVREGRVELETK
jgi:hypothetical protein